MSAEDEFRELFGDSDSEDENFDRFVDVLNDLESDNVELNENDTAEINAEIEAEEMDPKFEVTIVTG